MTPSCSNAKPGAKASGKRKVYRVRFTTSQSYERFIAARNEFEAVQFGREFFAANGLDAFRCRRTSVDDIWDVDPAPAGTPSTAV